LCTDEFFLEVFQIFDIEGEPTLQAPIGQSFLTL
jgi:hypothetical protein